MSDFSSDQLSAIRAAVAHLADGYALFDSDDHLLVWNKAYESLNTKVRDLVVEGATFESLTRAMVERGQIPEAVGREQQWIEERIRVRRSGDEDVERQVQVSDGRWFLIRERVTPDDGVVGIWCDITERVHTEEALRASDQQFRTTFDQDVFGMALRAVGTRESQWLDVNQKFCDILGYTRDEILRLTSIDITIAEEQQEAIDYNDKLLSGEINSYSREKRYVHKDGHIIWANIWLSVVQDRDGKPNKIISVVQDISERKRVDEALRVSEERYALAVSGTTNGLWDWNIQTGEDYQSPRWKEILGYEEHELENRHETFTDALHPEDHDRVMEAARAHLEERVPYDLEYRLRCKNGSYVWIHAKGQAIWDEFGTPLRMAGSNSDITERKQTEEALRESEARLTAIMENAPAEIYLKDVQGRYVLINRYYERLWGVTNEGVRGKMPADIHHQKEFADAARSHDLAVLGSGEVIEQENDILMEDGLHTLHMIKFPIRGGTGEIVGLGAIATDVTKSKKLQQIKNEFISSVSHELRTPMTSVLGALGLVQGGAVRDRPELHLRLQGPTDQCRRGRSRSGRPLCIGRKRPQGRL